MNREELDFRRKFARLSHRKVAARTGLKKDQVHRYFNPVELTREELHRVEAVIDAEIEMWRRAVEQVTAEQRAR